ncbi:hypothetical protein F4556_006705 [Kitasatospora gansuensis]|uniref:Leucine rich repeat (LRR) protein n=1 Tax=Kitasatospora gansuensis TaxID=258050 RepID=A0A7W7SIP3_9ACTN|nr:hypothetical protein [Kitasatospora gansuensis]MBB4951170.1 hypothetical protein [Kitasatospora gansuensis]
MDELGGALERAAADGDVVEGWLSGLAGNQVLPVEVLARLLEFDELPMPSYWLKYRTLDAAATELLVASPQIQRRLDVVENATADVDVLARLAQDPEPRVRLMYAVMLFEYKRRVPAGVLELLAEDPEPKIRRIVSDRTELPVAVRESPPVLTVQQRVAHPDPAVRREAAADPEVPTALALRLAEDPENDVRLAVSMREELTEDQRTVIPCTVWQHFWSPPSWIARQATDPEAARRIAGSAHVGLRRVLAAQPHLAPDVVALLAADEDEWVRRTLAERCEDAPHELLVELYATVQDRNWSVYRYHRNFARPGLARFADDPNPRLRHAALDDPEAGPELVLRLADDPEVGGWAVRDPRLPADELLRRLTLPAQASAAAGNPALPVAVMHRLLDLARAR